MAGSALFFPYKGYFITDTEKYKIPVVKSDDKLTEIRYYLGCFIPISQTKKLASFWMIERSRLAEVSSVAGQTCFAGGTETAALHCDDEGE
jgi:hypothetical protein